MAYSDEAISLLRPTVEELPRISDRVSFLFLDQARVEQGRTGLEAWMAQGRVAIPAATLTLLALGPGTSISAPAMATLFRAGTVVVFTSADGMIGYSSARPLASTGKWAAAQARIWADPQLRRAAAHQLYRLRYPSETIPPTVSLAALRGLEGQRVKKSYADMARRHKVKGFRRVTVGADDPVNVCLNRANSLLYGVALGVCSAFGVSPALGFIHEGAAGALLYDLADLFKLDVSIPAAFEAGTGTDPSGNIGRLTRNAMHRARVQQRMSQVLLDLLGPHIDEHDQPDRLLDDDGTVRGLVNWDGR